MKSIVFSATSITVLQIATTTLEVLFGKVRIKDFTLSRGFDNQVVGNAFRTMFRNGGPFEQMFEFRINVPSRLIPGEVETVDPAESIEIEVEVFTPERVPYRAWKKKGSLEISIVARFEGMFGPSLVGTSSEDRWSRPFFQSSNVWLDFSI